MSSADATPPRVDVERLAGLLPPVSDKLMGKYIDLLVNEGVEWGLLGPREPGRLVERHILNSLTVAQLIPEGSRVADVGSGAGLPGVPLAIVRPDLDIVLVEPMLRRVRFLDLVVEELDLGPQVTVVRSRAEDLADRFDVVTCRAVARLPKLLGWTAPLFLPSGELLALKGESVDDEVKASRAELTKLGCRAEVLLPEFGGVTAHVLRVRPA